MVVDEDSVGTVEKDTVGEPLRPANLGWGWRPEGSLLAPS